LTIIKPYLIKSLKRAIEILMLIYNLVQNLQIQPLPASLNSLPPFLIYQEPLTQAMPPRYVTVTRGIFINST